MDTKTDEEIKWGGAGFLLEPGGKRAGESSGKAGQLGQRQSFIEMGQNINNALLNIPVGIFKVGAIQL